MLYSIKCLRTINEAQIYLFLYFQSLFNHSSRVDCIFPAQCSSASSGLILFPTCIMMILKSILIISLRKLFIICYSHSVFVKHGIKKFWSTSNYSIIADNHKKKNYKRYGLFGSYILLFWFRSVICVKILVHIFSLKVFAL